MAGPLKLTFLRSYTTVDDLPANRCELAFVGRSNVGKSSLINGLAQRKKLAKTSKTPGATRLLNAYEVGDTNSGKWLMDLPGYGYARVSKAEQAKWSVMLGSYLEQRDSLVGALHLIDGVVGPTGLDLETVDWMRDVGLPLTFVATKADKVKSSQRSKRRNVVARKLGVETSDVIWVSGEKGTGLGELRSVITHLLD